MRRDDLDVVLGQIGARLREGTRVFLVGEASQLFEGWIQEAGAVVLAPGTAAGRAAVERSLAAGVANPGVRVVIESPGDVIPLPAGYDSRARPASPGRDGDQPHGLDLWHYDPYSVSFRLLARGDEEDYRVGLEFLQHGWTRIEEMHALLQELLPRFTNQTIQQDPAEFRRKCKGLLQMWKAVSSKQ